MSRKWVLIVLLMGLGWQAYADLNVDVEPKQVSMGDFVRLTVEVDATQIQATPDLSPLQKDFSVIGTQRQVSYSNVNGQASSSRKWVITLLPNRAGELVIPALKFGNEQTNALKIKVVTSPLQSSTSTAVDDSLMIKTTSSPERPYVNQQITYKIKVVSRLPLLKTELNSPKVTDGILFRLSDASNYRTQIKGQDYAVSEIQYAVFPQKSGEFIIEPPSLHALVFDRLNQEVRVQGNLQKIKVLPKPKAIKDGTWLPAKNVSLVESYDKSLDGLKAGDTFTRLVVINARDVPAQLLPTLKLAHGNGYQAYAQKPTLDNEIVDKGVKSKSTTKITYVLNKSGTITIPVIKAPWFNTETGKEEVAELPAKTINIVNDGKIETRTPATKKDLGAIETDANEPIVAEANPAARPSKWGFWLAMIFATAWAATIVCWYISRYKNSYRMLKRRAIKRLQEACTNNRARQAKAALLEWAQLQWPEDKILELSAVSAKTQNLALKKQMQHLSRSLYDDNHKESWDGMPLWESFVAFKNKQKRMSKHNRIDLPPINP